jgi:hypothetical protein
MSARGDVVKATVDGFARAKGFRKTSGRWCLKQEATAAVIELQKSQYGPQYFLNVGLWLLDLGDVSCPAEHTCHLRGRLETLMLDQEMEISGLLNPDDRSFTDEERTHQLSGILESNLWPMVRMCSTFEGVRAFVEMIPMGSMLISGSAQRLLGDY